MEELATVHWEKNNGVNSELSRIYWVMEQIEWYYHKEGWIDFLVKEKRMAEKFNVIYETKDMPPTCKTVSLLDVGSCYNPFAKFSNIHVTAIDLVPANGAVLKCDFLKVSVGDCLVVDPSNCCKQLPKEGYDIVLFSLLLEYMPSPKQRFECCQKACLLLKGGGILLILTPDSKHASANSKLVKNWRLALASLGFLLLKTEKLKHLRCLTFAKSNTPEIAHKWLLIQKNPIVAEEAIAIPQDKNPYDNLSKTVENIECKEFSEGSELENIFAENFSHIVIDDEL